MTAVSGALITSMALFCRVEEETGMLFRFVIGHTESKAEEAAINQEIEENGAFLRLPIQVLCASIGLEPITCSIGLDATLQISKHVSSPQQVLQSLQKQNSSGRVLSNSSMSLLMSRLQEAYASLTTKTLVFLQLITSKFDADYIMKVDDDVYLRTDRLPYAMAQWTNHHAGLVPYPPANLLLPSQQRVD